MPKRQDGTMSTSRPNTNGVQSQPSPAGYSNNVNNNDLSGGGGGQEDEEEELAWGPSHPCFPHLNPHVPLSSPEYTTTRIIRIRRDWMIAGDLAPTYSNIYPEILDPLLPEPEFRNVLQHINTTLLRAFDPFAAWNWVDGALGVVTGWIWEDFRPGGVKKALRGLETWMEDWNRRVGARNGVRLISLRRTGYLGLDVQIPDPQIRVVGDDDGDGGRLSNDDDDDDDDEDDDDDDRDADDSNVDGLSTSRMDGASSRISSRR